MNIHAPIAPPPDAPTPHRFTFEEYKALWDAVLHRFDRKYELMDGVIYEMPADGPLTSRWNSAIARWLHTRLDEGFVVKNDQTLVLGPGWAPDPDHHVFPARIMEEDLTPGDVLLVIEVSHSTLQTDLGAKAAAYGAHGIREYWVIDPEARQLHAHRLHEDGSYGDPTRIGFTDMITARHIPGLSLRLSDLPRISR